MLGTDQPVILQLLEMPIDKAQAALQGRDDGARGLRVPAARRHGRHRRPEGRVQGRRRTRCWSAPGRAARAWSARTCCWRTRKIFIEQGKALDAVAVAQRQGAGRRQPGQHQRLHRDEVGAVAAEEELHRDAAPRPQPRAVAARREDRQAGRRDREAHASGATTRRRCTPTTASRPSTASRSRR